MNPVLAKVVGLTYVEAHSLPLAARHAYCGIGYRYNAYHIKMPAHLVLTVVVSGVEHDVWIDRVMRAALDVKALTAKRRDMIKNTMPAVVRVEPRVGRRGMLYYVVSKECINQWVDRINNKPTQLTLTLE